MRVYLYWSVMGTTKQKMLCSTHTPTIGIALWDKNKKATTIAKNN